MFLQMLVLLWHVIVDDIIYPALLKGNPVPRRPVNQEPQIEPLKDIQEAAEILRRSHWTIRRDCQSGKNSGHPIGPSDSVRAGRTPSSDCAVPWRSGYSECGDKRRCEREGWRGAMIHEVKLAHEISNLQPKQARLWFEPLLKDRR